MIESGFLNSLWKDAPLTCMEIKHLIEFFKEKDYLGRAIFIYNQEGFVSLMDYKNQLEKIIGVEEELSPSIKNIERLQDSWNEDKKIVNSFKEPKTVAFCMRCFCNSAIPITKDTNFCHYCGSEGTCIIIKDNEAAYLRMNIQDAVIRAKQS